MEQFFKSYFTSYLLNFDKDDRERETFSNNMSNIILLP